MTGKAMELTADLIPRNPDVRLEMSSLGWRKAAAKEPGKVPSLW